jgi:hypothetical protein
MFAAPIPAVIAAARTPVKYVFDDPWDETVNDDGAIEAKSSFSGNATGVGRLVAVWCRSLEIAPEITNLVEEI